MGNGIYCHVVAAHFPVWGEGEDAPVHQSDPQGQSAPLHQPAVRCLQELLQVCSKGNLMLFLPGQPHVCSEVVSFEGIIQWGFETTQWCHSLWFWFFSFTIHIPIQLYWKVIKNPSINFLTDSCEGTGNFGALNMKTYNMFHWKCFLKSEK